MVCRYRTLENRANLRTSLIWHLTLCRDSSEAVRQAFLAGLGISALSRHALTLNQGQFAVLNVEGFPILRHWYAVYPAGRQLSVVAQAFLDYLLGGGMLRRLRRERGSSGATGCVRPNAILQRRSETVVGPLLFRCSGIPILWFA